jgi:hypothetical protein
MRMNEVTRCGWPHCQRLGAPSGNYCYKPAIKRLEDMTRGAEIDLEQRLARTKNTGSYPESHSL